MKRGFALLETIIVITFVSVSLLLLYGTFTSMIDNSRRNILYDDVANIYKMFYVKEYLELNGLQNVANDEDIQIITCDQFAFKSCSSWLQEWQIEQLYLVQYGLKDYQEEDYTSSFNNYLHSLANDDDYEYRLVGEFLIEDQYYYASIGVE